jgi:hypothetical protein
MSRAVVLLLAFALAGCAALAQLGHPGATASSGKERWVWQGKECPSDRRLMLDVGESNDERAYKLLCTEWPGFGQGGMLSSDLERRHAQLDDRKLDPFTTSVMALTCARFCNEFERIDVGMTAGLAELLAPEAVRASIEHLKWSADAKAFYVDRVKDAVKVLEVTANQLDARRKALYVDLPRAIRADRARYYQAHARDYAALDALEPAVAEAIDHHRADRQLADKLVALRSNYFATCASPDCRFDPFVIEVTRKVVLLALAADDQLGAAVEGTLFAERSAFRNAYAPTIHRALYLGMKQEEERWEAYDHAKQGGNDEATLTAKFGATPPIHITADSAWSATDEAASLLRGGEGKFTSVTGIVAAVRIKGELAEISFEDTLSSYELTDCVETNRIDAIGNDGRLIYRENCRSVGTKTERHTTPPIRIPRGEAASLHQREELTALVTAERVGGVVMVRSAKAQLVQYRTHRLRADARYVAISESADVDHSKKPGPR